MKELTKKIISVLFAVIFCLLCMINIAVPKSDFSETENRYLASMPGISYEALKSGEFMSSFEKYTADQFILRDFFVSLKAKLERIFMRTENNNVYFAKDGYLIEKQNEIDMELLNKNLDAIIKLNDLNRYNISVSIVPGAYEILKDKLPKNSYLPIVPKTEEHINNYFNDYSINFHSPKDKLTENKNEYIYYRTDHHQTSHGAYLTYESLGTVLGYTPIAKENFNIETVSDDFLGTTWSKAMVNKSCRDSIVRYSPKENNKFFIDFPFENKNMHSLYNEEHLQKKDKYSYFLDGNHGVEVIHSLNKNNKQLMVIKDSYAHSIIPFLANHYEKIHAVDLRYFNTDIIEYLHKNGIKDILFLYSFSGFTLDENVSKISSWCENSPYLKNPSGLVYETKPVSDSYFNSAVFIGDSLTEGLRLYNPELDDNQFLSYIGMSLFGINNRKFPDKTGTPMYSVLDMIVPMNADKFYIMLGTNDHISPETIDIFIKNYSKFVDNIKKYKPNSTIYLQSILPVTSKKELEGRFKNEYIYMYNDKIENLAREKNCFYLNVAEMCSDENGDLISGMSPDGVHLNIEYYKKWYSYLKTHAIGTDENNNTEINKPSAPKISVSSVGIEIAEDLKKNVPFTDVLWEIDNSIGVSLFNVDAKWVNSAAVYAGSGATAEEIAVFEYKDKESLIKLKDAVLKHLDTKKNSFENYLPSEVVKLSNPCLIETDKFLVLCVTDYTEIAEEIVRKYTNIQ